MTLQTLHICGFVYPNSILSPSPIGCYLLAHFIVCCEINVPLIQQLIIWCMQVAMSLGVVVATEIPLKETVPMPSIFIVIASIIIMFVIGMLYREFRSLLGVYNERSTAAAWKQIMVTSRHLVENRDRVGTILSELLPSGMLSTLQILDVSQWHEVSQMHENVHIVTCKIRNTAELSRQLSPASFVTVMHHCYSVCDRILRLQNLSCHGAMYKVHTDVDSYVMCTGMTGYGHEHRHAIYAHSFASQVLTSLNGLSVRALTGDVGTDIKLNVSAGVSVGSVVSTVIGSFPRFVVIGQAMTESMRMSIEADPGTILSSAVFKDSGMLQALDLDSLGDDHDTNMMEDVMINFRLFETSKTGVLGTSTNTSINFTVEDSMDLNCSLTRIVLEPCASQNKRVRFMSVAHSTSYNHLSMITSKCCESGSRNPSGRIISCESSMVGRGRSALLHVPSSSVSSGSEGYRGVQQNIKIVSSMSCEFYAAKSLHMMRAVNTMHVMIAAALIFIAGYYVAFNAYYLSAVYVIRTILHMMAPRLFTKYKGTEQCMGIATAIVSVILSVDMIDLIVSGYTVDVSIPEWYLAYGIVMLVVQINCLYIVYRLPLPHMMVINVLYCLINTIIVYAYYQSPFLLWRLTIMLSVCTLASVVCVSLSKIDYAVFKDEYQRRASSRGVYDIYDRIMPPPLVDVVKMRDNPMRMRSDQTEGFADFVDYGSNQTPVMAVSPLVAPVMSKPRNASSSAWTLHNDVVAVLMNITGLDDNDRVPIDEFGGLVRRVYDMVDRCATAHGVWLSHALSQHCIYAVSGYTKTSSSLDPATSALEFATDVMHGIRAYPSIKLSTVIACGNTLSAVVGEHMPDSVIWGSAIDRARDMIDIDEVSEVMVHESLFIMKPKLRSTYMNRQTGCTANNELVYSIIVDSTTSY